MRANTLAKGRVMHKSIHYGLAAVALLACVGLYRPARADNSDLVRMSWLMGMWESEPNEAGVIHEYVFEPMFNGELVSTQMEVRDGKTIHYEVRTMHDRDGKVILEGHSFKGDMSVSTPPPTRELESTDATHAIFTDMKLIRTGKNSMTLEFVQRPQGGAPKTTDIPMKRTMAFSRVKP